MLPIFIIRKLKKLLVNLTTGKFHIGGTFEMRTAPYEIHLFNDKLVMHDRVFIYKKLCGREQDSEETERERERERETVHCWK